jgi:intracellular sulfur oxidation DsrE/DsrF family protein
MQGDGVDLPAWARQDEAARRAADALKARGVRFEVCRNTLLQRRINPDARLHGVGKEDVVTTAVGEISALEQKGYVYIKL